jgi:AcrR family transcriptional regulator
MTARAEAAEATRRAILDAAIAAFGHLPFDRVTLNDVAAQSGVTVQTVIRRFGSKDQLFEAVVEREGTRILATRAVPEAADLRTALDALLDHYEKDGDVVLHLIAQEHHYDQIGEVVRRGRRVHREWVQRHCGKVLAGCSGLERERRTHAAIVATDLSTWKLLRRDLNLDRDEVAATMLELLTGLERL